MSIDNFINGLIGQSEALSALSQKSLVAKDELEDPTSPEDYKAAMLGRINNKVDAVISALQGLKAELL